MALQLEQFIPLPQAAKRLKVSLASLKSMIERGNIKAVKLNGTVAVAESELDQVITREKFERLRGQTITIPQASAKYNINVDTFRAWVKRGYIQLVKAGYGAEMDLADVAYCAAVYQAQGGGRGKRIFDEHGQPYQLKHTEWADYQRERRKKKTGPLSR
jgi:hypothetical protein